MRNYHNLTLALSIVATCCAPRGAPPNDASIREQYICRAANDCDVSTTLGEGRILMTFQTAVNCAEGFAVVHGPHGHSQKYVSMVLLIEDPESQCPPMSLPNEFETDPEPYECNVPTHRMGVYVPENHSLGKAFYFGDAPPMGRYRIEFHLSSGDAIAGCAGGRNLRTQPIELILFKSGNSYDWRSIEQSGYQKERAQEQDAL